MVWCSTRVPRVVSDVSSKTFVLQLGLALGKEELISAVVIGFRHEDFGRAVQVAVIGRAGVHEFLRGSDAVFLEHDDKHLRVHDRAGVEKLHKRS